MTSFDGWRAQPQHRGPGRARPRRSRTIFYLDENRRVAYMNCAIEST